MASATVIDLQPTANTYTFDPVSNVVQQGFPRVHQSHRSLKEVVDTNVALVAQTCESNRVSLRGGLNYDQFLAGMLYSDEQMLVSRDFLHYTHVVFQPVNEPGVTSVMKNNMSQGRAFLTNHRILLLSAEESQGLSISSQGVVGEDKKPYSYLLSGRCSDVLHFQSIPLGCVKNVELNASFGVNAYATINGHRPGFGLRMFNCFSLDMCLKKWTQEHFTTSALNQRILTLGVTLPPWGHKYMVQIHIRQEIPLTTVKDFVVDLQHFAPDLYTGAMTRKD